MEEDIPPGHVSLSSPMMPSSLPGSSDPATVYDFFWLTEDSAWATWATRIDTQPIPANTSFRRIIVPSVDTVRYTFLLDAAVRRGFPTLIVGPTGTGKSVMVHKYLYSLPGEEYVPPNIIGFSARTTANMTQYLIDAKLDRRRK
ncbi:uncharacterized protein HaLaN_24992, partial [Haematococcus lacustris]